MEGINVISGIIVRSTIGAIVIACSITTPSKSEARSCEPLFKSEHLFKDVKEAEVDRLKFSVDPKTKQTRVRGFVEIQKGRSLYIDFLKPAPGKPTIVLLNGLTYRLGHWDTFVGELAGDGLGIFRYDPVGMGETMKREGIPNAPIDIVNQAKDLALLLDRVGLTGKVHIAGLSYGGGQAIIFGALFPKRVASLILEAPLTGPKPELEELIQAQINATRLVNPWNPATDAELYSFFLRQIVYGQYPLLEPVVLEHPYKLENVFAMTLGTKNFRAGQYVSRLPKGKVHLMIAERDEYIKPKILEDFWNSVPATARASLLYVEHSGHKIPESMPHFSAEWIKLIIAGDSRIQDGSTWHGGVWRGGAISGKTKIEIE